jgi:hypothetical protein
MYVLITVASLYYGAPLRTYPTHADALAEGYKELGWFTIEEVVKSWSQK